MGESVLAGVGESVLAGVGESVLGLLVETGPVVSVELVLSVEGDSVTSCTLPVVSVLTGATPSGSACLLLLLRKCCCFAMAVMTLEKERSFPMVVSSSPTSCALFSAVDEKPSSDGEMKRQEGELSSSLTWTTFVMCVSFSPSLSCMSCTTDVYIFVMSWNSTHSSWERLAVGSVLTALSEYTSLPFLPTPFWV